MLLGALLLWCQTPRLWSLTWGSESDSCKGASAVCYSPVYGPLLGVWGDYIVSTHLLPSSLWVLLYVFGC